MVLALGRPATTATHFSPSPHSQSLKASACCSAGLRAPRGGSQRDRGQKGTATDRPEDTRQERRRGAGARLRPATRLGALVPDIDGRSEAPGRPAPA